MKRLCRYDAYHELFRSCHVFDTNCSHSSTVAPAVMQCVLHVIFWNAAAFLGYASKLQCISCNICWNVLGTSGWFYRRLEILCIVMEPKC
jgi:hypothetical protein